MEHAEILHSISLSLSLHTRTVVLIHMSAPTFMNMATAPAVPPRTALAEALSKISRKVGCGFVSAVSPMIPFDIAIELDR